jgi:hypothetical protein
VLAVSTIPVTLGAVNVLARDPSALARFWAELIGAEPPAASETVYLPPVGPGGFGMFFQPLGDEDRAAVQMTHLDLTVPSRQEMADRAVSLGATWCWEVTEEFEHVRWTTLTDPEGNYLCIAEHPPREGGPHDS